MVNLIIVITILYLSISFTVLSMCQLVMPKLYGKLWDDMIDGYNTLLNRMVAAGYISRYFGFSKEFKHIKSRWKYTILSILIFPAWGIIWVIDLII